MLHRNGIYKMNDITNTLSMVQAIYSVGNVVIQVSTSLQVSIVSY